ncbi:MAG: ABC transporter ATP-binding protein [Thermotoga caldifontis]|uniref:ABC transporter ATP-binding protein n=1 Tax=Thermotoga caldifontis TaxID=1508419 RepID=UPI003C7C6811
MAFISVNNLTAHYILERYGERKTIHAVEDTTFSMNKRDFLAIVGESGCGKSTLAKVLYGAVNSQLVVVNGTVTYQFEGSEYVVSPSKNTVREIWWKKLSYIPQSSLGVLNPLRKVRYIFLDLFRSHGGDYDQQRVVEHLNAVGLSPRVLDMYPFELSGGMRQRVVIALATLMKPQVIIADEPTSALDVVIQNEILQLLKRIQSETASTLVLITHDISLVPALANKLMIMYGGSPVEFGECRAVLSNPLHPYTKFLISSIPRIGDKTMKRSIPGYPPDLSNPPPGCRFHPRCSFSDRLCEEKRPTLTLVEDDHYVACWKCR